MNKSPENMRDLPMPEQMRLVLKAFDRKSPAEKIQLFVTAGLMTQPEADEAIARLSTAPTIKPRRSRPGRKTGQSHSA
jgi:hypothetical protein